MGGRDRSSIIVRLAITFVLLAAIVAFVDVRTVLSTARDAELLWIGAALVLLPINLLLEAAKWRLLLSQSVTRIELSEALGSVLAGYSLGLVTPARFGDYAGRVLSLSHPKKGALIVMAVLDRMYSIWIYAAVGTVCLGFQLEKSLPGPGEIWWLTFALGIAITISTGIFIANPPTLYAVSGSLLRWKSTRSWRRHFAAAAALKRPAATGALLLSLVRFGVFCTQFVALLHAFAPAVPIAGLYPGVVLVFFAKTVIPSISLFDLGIRESAAIFFLGFFGIAPAAALNASLLLFVLNLALPALVGIGFVPRLKWTRSDRSAGRSASVEARTG